MSWPRLAPGSSGPGRRHLWVGLGLFALAACGSTEPQPPPPLCPATLLLDGAERTTAYRADDARPSEIRYLAVLRDLTSTCHYYNGQDSSGVDVDLSFKVIAERGPAFSGGDELTYFIATMGPDRRILAKEMLRGDLTFAEAEERAGWSEAITLRLPSVAPGAAGSYTLYVGFQLDDAELARRQQPLLR